MHQPAHTPIHAQHVPPGWTFPTLTTSIHAGASPVVGTAHGGPASPGTGATTIARVRWGRLLPVFAGIALLAFGLWNVTGGERGATPETVGGGGAAATAIDIARSARGGTDATADSDARGEATPRFASKATTRSTSTRARSPRAGRDRRSAARARGARAVGPVAVSSAIAPPAPAAAGGRMGNSVSGGGGQAVGELPLTGIETWVAAFLGLLLLGGGVCVHVNAVRLAATALLYRRGILLRPVDCARMAQERGLPRARVAVSNVLHRLLEEASGDFVSARLAR